MNRKQIVLLICITTIAVVVGVGLGIKVVTTHTDRQEVYLLALVAGTILGLALFGLGTAFRDKKDDSGEN